MKKIIFLDHDGVICLSNNWGNRFKKQRKFYTRGNPRPMNSQIPVDLRFDNFDRKAVNVLNQIIEKTDAEIVVSSDWRFHATLDELRDYYESQRIIKRPIGITDNKIPAHLKYYSRSTYLEETRSYEILEWIDKNRPEKWVSVDDLNMAERFDSKGEYIWGLKNFVHTPISNEGIKQKGIEEKIMRFLI